MELTDAINDLVKASAYDDSFPLINSLVFWSWKKLKVSVEKTDLAAALVFALLDPKRLVINICN